MEDGYCTVQTVRPYYQYEKKQPQPPRRPLSGGITPVVKRILVANVIIFAIQLLLGDYFTLMFGLSHGGGLLLTAFRLFSYMFLHSPTLLLHLLTNMLALYLLGPEVERGMGGRHFLIMYLLSGFLGGLGWLLLSDGGLCVGASGAIMGMVASFAALYPRRRLVLILLPMFPIKAWILALGFGVLELLLYLARPGSTIAHTVHLAGGVAGCFYTLAVFRPGIFSGDWISKTLRARRGPRPRATGDGPPMEVRELDRILDKISREGMGSLTRRERKLLEDASKRRNARR